MNSARRSTEGSGRSRNRLPFRLLALIAAAGIFPLAKPATAGFVDVTDSAIAPAVPGVTYGLGWGDFDLDGTPDCFVCRHYERPLLYRNQGDGTLFHVFSPPLFDAPEDHHGPLVADFDEDGDPDIYLASGAHAGFGDSPKKLYRNDGVDALGRPVFVDVADRWGLTDLLARGRSASAMDVDRDGDVDLFVAKASRVASPNSLFLNAGGERYVDVAVPAGVADSFGSVGGIWGDYDGDGDADLLIGGEEEVSFQTRLYRNDGNTTFTNVTPEVLPGVGQIAAAAWGDADNDGDLDLAIGLGDRALFDAVTWDADTLRYFFNTRFGDDGLDGLAFVQSGDSATFDITIDGYYQPDSVFISETGFHPPFGPFTLPSTIVGAPFFHPGEALATYLWTQGPSAAWEMRCSAPMEGGHSFAGIITANGDLTRLAVVSLEPYSHGPRGTRLWRNDGGVFTDVSGHVDLADTVNVTNVQWIDVDQDGRLDLYVENAGDTRDLNQPNILYRNRADGTFEDVTSEWGLAGPAEGLGDAFAFEDYDLDGDLDVMILGGSGPRFFAMLGQVRLYRNDGVVGHRLRVDLEGSSSSRDGYGAWVTCVSATAGRQVRYVAGNTWRGCPTMLDPYFGLGEDASADTLIVEWPSGSVNVHVNVPAGVATIVENDPLVAAPSAAAVDPGLQLTARPNPASGAVLFIAGGRGEARPATLVLLDAGGRKILERELAPGVDRFAWNGRNSRGHPVAAGVYFARLAEGDRTTEARVVHLGR